MKTNRFERILLATDGSEPAKAAADVTASFARASRAKVLVVHVWNLELRHRHDKWDVEMRSEARELIDRTVTRIRAAGVEVEGELERADNQHVPDAIADVARQFDADLVVVGSRGLSDWQSLVVTPSISHQLLTALDCPVLVVREPSSVPGDGAIRVLLAIAGGDDLVPAVHAAIAVASAPGSEVRVLHVPQAVFVGEGFGYIEPDEEIEQTIKQATTMLSEAGVAVSTVVIPAGSVVRAVADTAADWSADVIVTGSRRMGDLGSILFGSVSHGLLRATQRPVLVAERAAR